MIQAITIPRSTFQAIMIPRSALRRGRWVPCLHGQDRRLILDWVKGCEAVLVLRHEVRERHLRRHGWTCASAARHRPFLRAGMLNTTHPCHAAITSVVLSAIDTSDRRPCLSIGAGAVGSVVSCLAASPTGAFLRLHLRQSAWPGLGLTAVGA